MLTLAGVAALALASGACAPRSGGPAVAVVEELEQAWQRGDRERVHDIVDFRARIEEMLGDVWRGAPPEDQDEAVDLARAMFDTTMERYWTSQYEGRPHQTRISRIDGPHVWVESRASGDGRSDFAWIYRVTSSQGRYRVTQRELKLGPVQSNTSAFYPLALKRIGQEYGRRPTLSELNANLPSLLGTMRERTYVVPDLKHLKGRGR
ncbi:MAG: hypothetical protein H6745_10735 [Deltaproteobacteria bacterium]|nr:hypothetical protein [Deltaproteobacteria bacterium]